MTKSFFSTLKVRLVLPTVALGAGTALVLGGAFAASALSYNPYPAVDGEAITVTSDSNDLPAGTYRVGVCTTESFGFAPACGAYSDEDVVLTEPGQIVDAVTAPVSETENANAHAALPGQPDEFNCVAEGACVVVIVNHTTKQIVESAPLIFQ